MANYQNYANGGINIDKVVAYRIIVPAEGDKSPEKNGVEVYLENCPVCIIIGKSSLGRFLVDLGNTPMEADEIVKEFG